ncbi:hypothetical protein CRG98_022400 [Punica granatum]|uniref:SIS domain-containing protein n=1 Tax=Punica granatum TaxID=22663 RepID=A0A2I0JLN2_PUNGR|nr:hypothetical protein CRG98_022400 [Punica granatum]
MPLLLRLHDVLVLFSKSGNTKELLRLVPRTRAKGTFLISITSAKEESLLKGCCNMNVWLPLERELCPFGLTLVMQTVFENTVAIALTGAKNLTMEWSFPVTMLYGRTNIILEDVRTALNMKELHRKETTYQGAMEHKRWSQGHVEKLVKKVEFVVKDLKTRRLLILSQW